MKQFLHLNRLPVIWKERWLGPENLDRAELRITGFDTYALIAGVLLQVVISLYGSQAEPDPNDPSVIYPKIQRAVYETQMAFLMLSALCSTYTMVTFLICKIFSTRALATHMDVAFQIYTRETRPFRLHGYWALISALLAALVAFTLNLFTRIKGNRGLCFTFLFFFFVGAMLEDWRNLVRLGVHWVYPKL